MPFGSICQNDRRKTIEKLSQEVEFLEDQVFLLKTRLLEAIMVKMPADVENRKLARLGDTLEENVQMLNNTINTAIYEVTDFVEKGECTARYIQDRHRITLIIAANFQNLTTQYQRIINDINQRRISLANMAAMMQDEMSSLVHGYLLISLIPPATLKEILSNFEFFGLNEAIPRKLIAAYYTFEVVRDAYVSDEGLHLLLEIPLNPGHGVHEVFRATPIPQPIPNTKRATQYQLSKTHLLMSWDKTNFAEVTEQELSTHCWGSHLLRLQTAILHHPIAENHLSHGALFQSPRYGTEIMRTRSHSPPTTPTSPLSIRHNLFVDVRQGRFCDTERHTIGRLQNARVSKLSGSTYVQRTAAIAECRVIFDTRAAVVFDGG